jgi:ribosomal protein L15E
LRAGLAELEKLFGTDSEETAPVRRKLAEAERAAEERLTVPQRRDRHRAELEAARQALAGTFERVRELGQEKKRIEKGARTGIGDRSGTA